MVMGEARMRVLVLLVSFMAVALAAPARADTAAAWAAMSEPGHVILMRHANAPGTGDPANFTLDDCSTQRNLDARGREQARRIGVSLRDRGITDRPVYTSRWCRCRETAELLAIGPVEPLDGLNSFFGDAYAEDEVMPRLRAFLRGRRLDPPPILVTHQVNISAFADVYPREGEMVVVAVGDDGRARRVIGRLRPDD